MQEVNVNGFKNFQVAAFMSAALFLPNMVQAKQIQQYDKMADQDQAEYIAELVQGAEDVLTDAGRADQAAQVKKLFTTYLGNDRISVGLVEFNKNLVRARVADEQNVEKDPNATRLEVEDAMYVTLQKNGIELPDSFFTVLSTFQPKLPPKNADTPTPPPG
jgi:hypothetical protein